MPQMKISICMAFLAKKTGRVGPTILKRYTKRIRKRKFCGGSRSLWIVIFKTNKKSTFFQALISNILKYFLSETIHAQENGSRGTHFAEVLISNFLKDLTYSAVGVIVLDLAAKIVNWWIKDKDEFFCLNLGTFSRSRSEDIWSSSAKNT